MNDIGVVADGDNGARVAAVADDDGCGMDSTDDDDDTDDRESGSSVSVLSSLSFVGE